MGCLGGGTTWSQLMMMPAELPEGDSEFLQILLVIQMETDSGPSRVGCVIIKTLLSMLLAVCLQVLSVWKGNLQASLRA